MKKDAEGEIMFAEHHQGTTTPVLVRGPTGRSEGTVCKDEQAGTSSGLIGHRRVDR